MEDELAEREYNPFVTNRTLSYFIDTVLQANEVNQRHQVDHRLQFDYLINTVRKKKRFSKWIKPSTYESIELVKEYYGYSDRQAKDVVDILSHDQLEIIRRKLVKGGT
jgi:hypothetical protein